MSKGKELAKNTLIIMLGKICTQFISFLLIPFYTYFLSTKEYGQVDLIITYIGLFVPVITIQLEMSMFRFLIDCRDNNKKKTGVFTNIFSVVLVLIVIFSIIYLIVSLIFKFPYKMSLYTCIIATILSNLFLQSARGLGNNIKYSAGCIIAGVSNIVFNLIFILGFKMQGNGVLVATALSNLFCTFYLFISNKLYTLVDFNEINKNSVKKYLKYSSPLVPNSIMWWIINASDRTIITIFIGATANGIFAVSHKFATIVASLYNIFNLSWTESSSLHINEDDKDEFFSDTLKKVLFFSSAVCCCMISVLPLCFNIIISHNYHEAYIYIPPLVIGSFFNIIISFVGGIYIALKKTEAVAKTSFWSGIINIAINLLFVKIIGVWASAISIILAFLIMCIYRMVDVQKYVKLKIGWKSYVVIILQFAISIILYYVNNSYLNIMNIIIVIISSIILNRYILIALKQIILNRKKKRLNKVLSS